MRLRYLSKSFLCIIKVLDEAVKEADSLLDRELEQTNASLNEMMRASLEGRANDRSSLRLDKSQRNSGARTELFLTTKWAACDFVFFICTYDVNFIKQYLHEYTFSYYSLYCLLVAIKIHPTDSFIYKYSDGLKSLALFFQNNDRKIAWEQTFSEQKRTRRT